MIMIGHGLWSIKCMQILRAQLTLFWHVQVQPTCMQQQQDSQQMSAESQFLVTGPNGNRLATSHGTGSMRPAPLFLSDYKIIQDLACDS